MPNKAHYGTSIGKRTAIAAALVCICLTDAHASAFRPHIEKALTLPYMTRITGSTSRHEDQASGILGSWHQYALNEISPEYVSLPVFKTWGITPGLMSNNYDQHYRLNIQLDEKQALAFSYDSVRLGASVTDNNARTFAQRQPGAGLGRTYFSSGFARDIGSNAVFGISAVLAQQKFQQFDYYGTTHHDAYTRHALASQDNSQGTGLRLGLQSEIAPNFLVAVAYQTRIDMDKIEGYRDVFNDPADFDIPASTQLKMTYKLSEKQTVSLDTQYLMYSEVSTFTSYLLPDRFLSLLGDGGSPEFQWDDLVVNNLSWHYQANDNWGLQLNIGTAGQPAPTATVLYSALAPDYADYHLSMDLMHSGPKSGELTLSARYAQPEPFYNQLLKQDSARDKLELEATWVIRF